MGVQIPQKIPRAGYFSGLAASAERLISPIETLPLNEVVKTPNISGNSYPRRTERRQLSSSPLALPAAF
jgi:hypothetical protein